MKPRRSLQIFAFACGAALLGACTKVSTNAGHAPALGGSGTVHGVVRYAIPNDLNSLNPVIGGLAYENAIESAVFDGLVKLDDQERLIPDLATEIPSRANGGISADGKTITYHLRHGVTWQDGAPFTSADVAFTVARIMDPNVNAPNSGPYTHIASIETPDDFTVVVRLKAPWAPALGQLFCNGENGSIIPKHLLERSADFNHDPFGIHPVGTGPLRLVSWERGAQIELEANPRYFGGAPRIREVVIPIIPDANTRLTTLISHELDFATAGNPAEVSALRRALGLRVLLVKNYACLFIEFNVSRSPLDDVRVRRALAMALDRRDLTTRTFLGTAVPADSFIPPFSWAYAADNGSPPYDVAGAQRLLDEAGWHPGADGIRRKGDRRLTFDLLTSTGASTSAAMAEQLQQAWRVIGADVSVRSEPLNVLRSPTGLLVTGNFEAALLSFIFDPDPDRSQNLGSQFIGARGFNDMRYVSRRSDALSAAAVEVYDHAQRKPIYAQLQRIWNADLPIVPLAWEDNIDVINSDLRGFRPEPVNSDFWNVVQWEI
jgi:peptide/nickel transport system substrate-binding protein